MPGLRTIILSLVATSPLPGALSLTIHEAASDGVLLEVHGNGFVDGSISPLDTIHFLVVGTADDSFLSGGEIGQSDLTAVPSMSLEGFTANQHLYRDDNGTLGLNSYLEFDFPTLGLPTIGLDLNTLTGTYLLSDWRFSDFIAGSYNLTTPTPLPVIFSGAGLNDITLEVVPEPSSALFSIVVTSFFLGTRRR